MLYYLHILHDYGIGLDSEFLKAFNVFQYITFRAVAAGVTAFLLSLFFGNWVIRHLVSLKLGQPIRSQDEVHRLHELHGAKAGTPTMGGVLLLGAILISTLLWARPTNTLVWLALFSVIYLGTVGFIDDYLKVTKKSSDGISSRLKFALQCVLAVFITGYFLFALWLNDMPWDLYVPFSKEPVVHLRVAFPFIFTFIVALVFYLLVIVGSSNAVNLTDGLDGLAAGCTATVAFGFAVLTYAAGHHKIAQYLQIPYVPFSGELAVVCLALVGAALGFLWWNCHPARVFMGDTGSLAIGGLLGVVAIAAKQELLLALIGGVFVLEAGSVILQVASFKLTGKRIFKMSPLHHHFELSGWKESTVIVRFWILSVIFALLGLATLKLR
ncbi:MAG: phospho-N-acetylmuramoyl-pentapeptide-transferase [Chthoniobacterales bacterium]|nr:phospho-N-acetylmuramoyl-pentapeptide-transferase [Chthoniobacterales bacterium]